MSQYSYCKLSKNKQGLQHQSLSKCVIVLKWQGSKITWVENVTNYNHKTITCNKLTPNFKVSMYTQKLKKMSEYSNPFQFILSLNPKIVAT
jgi:hypothetical protein